jgi:hypothetical protein
MNQWHGWINGVWPQLVEGAKVTAPWHLSHPRWAGFATTALAEPNGQVADWVLPMSDGSRIHVHEKPDGAMLVHRDAADPERGIVEAAIHFFTESMIGRVVGIGLIVVAIRAALSGSKR